MDWSSRTDSRMFLILTDVFCWLDAPSRLSKHWDADSSKPVQLQVLTLFLTFYRVVSGKATGRQLPSGLSLRSPSHPSIQLPVRRPPTKPPIHFSRGLVKFIRAGLADWRRWLPLGRQPQYHSPEILIKTTNKHINGGRRVNECKPNKRYESCHSIGELSAMES